MARVDKFSNHSLVGMESVRRIRFLRPLCVATLEATQGQIDGFFRQLPYKCHQNRVASVGD